MTTLARVVRIPVVLALPSLLLSLLLLLLLLLVADGSWAHVYPREIKPGCRYEGRRYQEGTAVGTSEPCLRCRCTEGALRCRLRVCPRLPNPPPSGCRIRAPVDNVCCAELVCGEPRDVENMLRRAGVVQTDAVVEDERQAHHSRTEGCLHEGVRYGSGSAMMGSRRCEYCYCISGARRCIRPKCLLPLPGCSPLYAPHSCCPVAYNCTHHHHPSTMAPISGNGCRVGRRTYAEGEMVRDIEWKAACDNCFCAMGAIRCVPLACAPPLQGCSPIVREGQCCPSTYNCSGSIEVNATQNYASYAFISKDYAKFRKETNFILSSNTESTAFESPTFASTKDADSVTDSCATCSTTNALTDSTIAATTTTDVEDPSSTDSTTISSAEWTTPLPELTLDNGNDENEDSGDEQNKNASGNEERENEHGMAPKVAEKADIIEKNKATTHPFAISTDAGDVLPDYSALAKRTEAIGKRPVTSPSSTILMPDDMLVMNVTVKTNVSVGHMQGGIVINPIKSAMPPDVEAILNITHREKAEDYDYNGQALLPNVRIIPFLAADALVNGKDVDVSSAETGYSPGGSVVVSPELRPTDASGFYDIATQENRFSPPVETEGGFVPREPPYFDVPYYSTDLNLEVGTGVTVAPAAQITNPHGKDDDLSSKCRLENAEYRHSEILPSTALCIICMCYYGEVVCSSEKCAPLKIGCQRIASEGRCCGEVVCVNAGESPTVVLNRAGATAPSRQQQPTVSPDPFRDVIKTEPAPDLPSLIEDMIRGITTARPTTSAAAASKTPAQGLAGNQLQQQRPPNFDFMEQVPLIRPPFDYDPVDDSPFISDIKPGGGASSSGDTVVPATYDDSEPRIVNRRPVAEAEVLSYDTATLGKFNRTVEEEEEVEDSGKLAQKEENAAAASSPSKQHDGNSGGKVDNRVAQHDNRSESSNGSSIAAGTRDEEDKSAEEEEKQDIFSIDGALELLFSSNASGVSSSQRPSERTTKTPDVAPVGGGSREGQGISSTTSAPAEEETETVETPSKLLDNEIPISVGSLLKLAGCNIYGRMYRVGRIIAELSNPCLECRCTEIGVQCKPLQC